LTDSCDGSLSIASNASAIAAASRSFGRSPECTSSYFSAHGAVNTASLLDSTDFLNDICCGLCLIDYPTVDVSYWPVEGADTSCVNSTLDNRPANATFTSVVTSDGIIFDGSPFSIGSVPVQLPGQFNPYASSLTASGSSHVVKARAHPLLGDGSSSQSNVVGPDGFTYTYPSIYVAFHDVSATDKCGQFGQVHTSVTLAFAPDELSTVEGPFNLAAQTTKSFNFADLPCPPQSVLSADWYTLGPGQPYRPRLALPKKLQRLDPAWSTCSGYQAEGIDPPKALSRVSSMDPATTQVDPAPLQTPATPSKAHDPLPASTSPAAAPKVPPANNDNPKDPASPPKPSPDPPQPSVPKQNADPPNSDPTASQASSPNDPPASALNPSSKGVDPKDPSASASADPPNQQNQNSSPNPKPSSQDQHQPNNPQNPNPNPSPDPENPNQSPPNQHDSNLTPQNGQNQNPDGAAAPSESNAPVIVVQGQTVSENGPAITVGGAVVAFSSGSIHVGSSIAPVIAPSPQQPQQNPAPQVVGGLTFSQVQPSAEAVPLPVTVGGHPASVANSAVMIGGITVAPGSAAITISGTPVSLGSLGLVVGSNTVPLPAPVATPIATVAGHMITPAPSGNGFVVDKTTLIPGAPPITISGTPISLGSAGLVVGSSIIALPPSSIFTVGGQTFTANAAGFVLADTSMVPGGPPVTISGTRVSLGSSGGLVIGGSTVNLASLPRSSIFTVGGQTFTANPTAIPIMGTTISRGGPGITISGTPISLGPSGLIIGTSTIPLASTINSVFTIGSQTFTANSTGFSIAGTSILPGQPAVTISGTPVSLGSSGLVVGTSTVLLPSMTNSVFTIDGQTFTANPTGFSIAGTSILPGQPAITISGTPVSLGPSDLFIGTNIIPLATTSSGSGFGGLILSGLGKIGPTSTAANGSVQYFEGAQPKLEIPRKVLLLSVGMSLCIALRARVL